MIVMLDIWDKLRFGISPIVAADYEALCASHPRKGIVDVVGRSDGDSQ